MKAYRNFEHTTRRTPCEAALEDVSLDRPPTLAPNVPLLTSRLLMLLLESGRHQEIYRATQESSVCAAVRLQPQLPLSVRGDPDELKKNAEVQTHHVAGMIGMLVG